MQYSGSGTAGTLAAHPVPGADALVAGRAGAVRAAEQANTPHELAGPDGQPTFAAPQPMGGTKSYFGAPPAGLQTTSQKSSQEEGGKSGQKYSADLAKDAQGALDVHRSLHEMLNLSKVTDPTVANKQRGQVASVMMGLGMNPEAVGNFLGISPGALEAANKQNSHLAQSSTKMVTSRGTNFDLDTFMKNNPNLAMTPEGFHRVVDFMDKLTQDTIKKQQHFQTWKQTGLNGQPVPADEWEAGHTAEWNKIMLDEIRKGKTDSRPHLSSFEK
jgi:hypothetical protein